MTTRHHVEGNTFGRSTDLLAISFTCSDIRDRVRGIWLSSMRTRQSLVMRPRLPTCNQFCGSVHPRFLICLRTEGKAKGCRTMTSTLPWSIRQLHSHQFVKKVTVITNLKYSAQHTRYLEPALLTSHSHKLLPQNKLHLQSRYTDHSPAPQASRSSLRRFPHFRGPVYCRIQHSPLVSTLSQMNAVHGLPSSLRFTLILSIHLRLGLPSSLFPSVFPWRSICFKLTCFHADFFLPKFRRHSLPYPFSHRPSPSYFPQFQYPNVAYKSQTFSLCNIQNYPLTSPFYLLKCLPKALCFQTLVV